ncbi:hypothetical protein [Flavobacterium piscinae]|uniref:hypothetical protein n=1 Tax=Flavobacterium piscinae TaxID=2506424 RepID=UPI002AAACCC6|nr:hypothetical protein [Flavobacterium piscinae]
MESSHSFKIVRSTNHLPSDWNVLATSNIFLSKEYLAVLEQSKPTNMDCFFIALYKKTNSLGLLWLNFWI